MANSFSPANAYNGQYGQSPFYPSYLPNPGATNTSHSTSLPAPPFPPLSTNAQRFEANSHVPSPPLPGQIPLNPEVLRQLAASGNLRFPFPPPPPPPPPQLFSSSFPPGQPATNATAPPSSHQFPPFHPSRPQFQTATPPLSQTPKANADSNGQIDVLHERNGTIKSGVSRPDVNGAIIPTPQVAHSLDGTTFSRVTDGLTRGTNQSQNAADSLPGSTPKTTISDKALDHGLRHELHLKAKAAIKECLSVGADYDFWLKSGVDNSVLDSLFDELNINRRASAQQSAGNLVRTAQQESSANDTKQDPLPSSQTPQPDVLDRKNRIALLLAAKKGQPLTSAKSSQSGSPAPERFSKPEALSRKQDESQPQQISQSKMKPDQDDSMTAVEVVGPVDQAILSPVSATTPSRTQAQQSAFAIPGLFMTSADEAEYDKQLRLKESAGSLSAETVTVQLTAPKSLKRRAEPLSEDVLPQNKRQASYALKTPAKAESTTEMVTPSDPAHVTGPSTAAPRQFVNESEKMTDASTVTPSRSKVNQSVLKDRMAALKAQLQMNKARKEALQDGMPALVAEVEKTRQSLKERHSRLATVRTDIELKETEISTLRTEESDILQEIRKLDSQLVDGENGQRLFSNELDQLDDQIQVNETESASSQKSISEHTRPTTAISRPVSSGRSRGQSQIESAPTVTLDEPASNGGLAVAEPVGDLRRSLTTEYNPEQAALDQQLKFEPVPAIQNQTTDVSDDGTDNIPPSGSTDATPGPEVSNGNSAMEEQQSEIDSEDDRMSIDEASDAGSSGSASMSDSGSEDYEPALNEHEIQPELVEDTMDDEYEPAEPDRNSMDADNDDYEPAEEVNIIDVERLEDDHENNETPPTVPEPVLEVSAPSANSALVEDVTPPSSSPTVPTSTSQTSPIITSVDQKLTIPQQPAAINSLPVLAPLSDSEKPVVSRFVPYQSPLASFKSFRFHPHFGDVVKNGFRSLTYSNNIDPKTPVCVNELEGRFCDDVKCVDQHFGSMALTDDKILVQMSSANDLKDKDQRDAYLLGLKKVIASLREQGVREFSEVANALSKYRREWVQEQDSIVA